MLKVFTRHGVFANVNVKESAGPSILGRPYVSISQVHFSIPNRLNFGSFQRYSCFQSIHDFIVSVRKFVDSNGVVVWFLFLFPALCLEPSFWA